MPEVIFTGAAGRLEGKYQSSNDPKGPVALILHPHPQHGGTMNNKVVYTLYRTFSDAGFNVFRFNFRGVGKSQGSYDNGEGELSDAASALDWLQSIHSASTEFWVSGFSFGAWVAMQLLMRRPELSGFVAVSPPADRYDFNFLAPCPVSGQIIQGEKDAVVTPSAAEKLANKLNLQRGIKVDYSLVKGADHFYSQQLVELSNLVGTYVKNRHDPREEPQKLAVAS